MNTVLDKSGQVHIFTIHSKNGLSLNIEIRATNHCSDLTAIVSQRLGVQTALNTQYQKVLEELWRHQGPVCDK